MFYIKIQTIQKEGLDLKGSIIFNLKYYDRYMIFKI